MNIVPMSVTLIDSMGSDLSVVNAARVSFNKESDWEPMHPSQGFGMAQIKQEGTLCTPEHGSVKLKDSDAKLINYLAKHGHWTPFGHAFLSFRIKAPIFVARQLVKHQVGLCWNEVSRRYVNDEPEFWFPEVWRGKPVNAKQGSSDVIVDTYFDSETRANESVMDGANYATEMALMIYKDLINSGVAPEQARMVLPLNSHTEWIWSGSLAAFARVCNLRICAHAQAETNEVAQLLFKEIPSQFQHSWKALTYSCEGQCG
jgi:thymidylate synthase (FAD)